jgi:hypothetical protein
MNLADDDPLKLAVAVKTEAEFMRLPQPGQHDPIFGLKRSYMNLLVLPCRDNAYRPPVKSILLRRKGTRKGVRLIEIASLRAYIRQQMDEAEKSQVMAAESAEPKP